MFKEIPIPIGDGKLPNGPFAPSSYITNAPRAEEARLLYA
jgi:hypothetical protein